VPSTRAIVWRADSERRIHGLALQHRHPEHALVHGIACDAAKADRTPEEARMKLRRRPRRPTFLPSITVRMGGAVPVEWRPYWSGELQS
jgi:hypothetical protein